MPKGEKTKLLWQNPEFRKHMSKVHKGKIAYHKGRDNRLNKKCLICKKDFRTYFSNRKYCSHICYCKAPAWNKGLFTIERKVNGYMLIYCPNHPFRNCKNYVKRSRLVMETHLGRYLKPEEVVHHINGIKDDDRIENLKLFENNGQHTAFHRSLLRAH